MTIINESASADFVNCDFEGEYEPGDKPGGETIVDLDSFPPPVTGSSDANATKEPFITHVFDKTQR